MLRGRVRRSSLAILLASFAAALSARSARAGTFTGDGALLLDAQAAATFDFEDGADPGGGAKLVEDPGALSGGHVLRLAAFQGVYLPVKLPALRRTYRLGMWIRGNEVTASITLSYSDHWDEVTTLYPTGRITSDGWVEVANDRIRVDGLRLKNASVDFFSAVGADVDAVELVPDGGEEDFPSTPNAPCNGVTDPSACAPEQLCVWSECRNVRGWVPPIPADREHVVDYLERRIRMLFGPYLERAVDLPAVLVSIDQMRHAKDRWTFWNGFTAAVRKLHDGHTTTSGVASFVLVNPRPLALCFLEGDADLTHAEAAKDPDYLDVLVSHVGPDHNLGLQAGDRLVRVDGQHPIAWARALVGFHWDQPGISNHTTFAELASSLRATISRYAKEIEVIRCDAAGACQAPETISIRDVPFDAPGTPFTSVTCDNRPARHLAGAPADHATGEAVYAGIVNDSNATEKIYGVEWESLYTTNGTDGVGAALHAAVDSWIANDARGVILDHRTGFGGTILAPEILWGYAVPVHPNDLYVDRTFAAEEQPLASEAQARFQAALGTPSMQYAGSANPVTDVPVALLLTEDVSASDWLPQGMKGAPKVRIFAPFQTNGGFSTRYALGYWLGMGYVMAVGDDILPDGTTHNGKGVEPDVIVLPKQSDLVKGKDTLYEAALAWIRQEQAP